MERVGLDTWDACGRGVRELVYGVGRRGRAAQRGHIIAGRGRGDGCRALTAPEEGDPEAWKEVGCKQRARVGLWALSAAVTAAKDVHCGGRLLCPLFEMGWFTVSE